MPKKQLHFSANKTGITQWVSSWYFTNKKKKFLNAGGNCTINKYHKQSFMTASCIPTGMKHSSGNTVGKTLKNNRLCRCIICLLANQADAIMEIHWSLTAKVQNSWLRSFKVTVKGPILWICLQISPLWLQSGFKPQILMGLTLFEMVRLHVLKPLQLFASAWRTDRPPPLLPQVVKASQSEGGRVIFKALNEARRWLKEAKKTTWMFPE